MASAPHPLEFRLAPGMADAIIAHARHGYPDEICGLISGREGQAVELHPGRNVSATPRTTFELDVDTLALQIQFADEGLDLVGIYHSHPAGPDVPSATDVARSYYPEAVYLICSMADASYPSLRAFRILANAVSEVRLIAP